MRKLVATAFRSGGGGMPSRLRLTSFGMLLCCLQTALSQNENDTTFGVAHLTKEVFPLKPNYQIVNAGYQVHCGKKAISHRIEVEEFAYKVHTEIFAPINAELRYSTYSAHPSVTPGMSDYNCVIYGIQAYALNGQGPELFAGANALYLTARQAEQKFLQTAGYPIKVYLASTYKVGPNITAIDTADVLARLELNGPDLAPFTYDKQFLLTSAIFRSSSNTLPVATVNMSGWSALQPQVTAATGIGPARRRLQPPANDTITLEAWLALMPPTNGTAASAWQTLKPGIESIMAEAGFPMTVTFRNATVYNRPKGAKFATVTRERQDGTIIEADSGRRAGGGGLTVGAIAGLVVAAAAVALVVTVAAVSLALALAAFGILRRRRRQQRGVSGALDKPYASGEVKLMETSSSGDSGLAAYAIATPTFGGGSTAIPPREVTLCRKSDGDPWLLGSGSFGKVYKAKWRGHHEVAVKQLTCFADERLLQSLQKEIDILKKVSFNRNVVQFYGFSMGGGDGKLSVGACENGPMLVMEFLEGGDLRRALWKQPEEFAWHKRGQHVAMDTARGMHFLHSSGVIHRDIKTSNVLLNRDGTAKLADVGLAITADYFSAGSATGTFSYASPELLMGGKCSPKVDVYSFGVVLWEIVTRLPPVRGRLREVQPDECPPEVNQLLVDCITVDVDQRPTAAEVLERLEAIVPPRTEPDG